MKKINYFMHLDLPQYGKVGLIEATGFHYFLALSKAKGDVGIMFKYMLLEVLFINDKKVDEKFIDKMPAKDVSYLLTVLGTMMENKLI